MKHLILFIIITFSFLNCNYISKAENKKNENLFEKKLGKKFFDYDEIDYYSTNFEEEKISDLHYNKSKSKLDSIKIGVILKNIPKNISDLSFIQNLELIGYNKSIVDKSKFNDIDKIFVEKSVEEYSVTSCIHIYRDILIFKKENKVVGTAKICFECLDAQITGTKAVTENFGQNGDYKKLETILKK